MNQIVKPTPGPWILSAFKDSTVIAETATFSVYGIYQPEISERDNVSAKNLDFANAVLIANAPEMLEALEKLAAIYNDPSRTHFDLLEIRAIVNDAIRNTKARPWR